MQYNKLVRDRIPEIIEAKGQTCKTHIAEEMEYAAKLKEKLQEEAAEFVKDDNIEELADLLEVVEAIKKLKGFDSAELEKVRLEKHEKRGGFEKRIILEES
jgi:predicted house-cleaning noncanonical NTP pyrophosphatase (MazG superfamily)